MQIPDESLGRDDWNKSEAKSPLRFFKNKLRYPEIFRKKFDSLSSTFVGKRYAIFWNGEHHGCYIQNFLKIFGKYFFKMTLTILV